MKSKNLLSEIDLTLSFGKKLLKKMIQGKQLALEQSLYSPECLWLLS